jgi:hypothetical protein
MNDKANRQGTLTFVDGRVYTGSFKDGKNHGEGTLASADGEVYSGSWEDGNMVGIYLETTLSPAMCLVHPS